MAPVIRRRGQRQRLPVDRSGLISGLQVVGYHGDVTDEETPARCGPVYALSGGRLARIVHLTPREAEVDVQIVGPPLNLAPWPLPGLGTRCGPWPARVNAALAVTGSEERRDADRMRLLALPDDPPAVDRFLAQLADGGWDADLDVERQNTLAVWHCAEEEVACLFDRVRRVAEEDLLAATRDDRDGLAAASWRLSRAAISDPDVYLASVGLQRAGVPGWEIHKTLLADQRSAWGSGVADAERRLAQRL